MKSLKQSKLFTEDIQMRMRDSKHTEEQIKNSRNNFEEIVNLSSKLFFTVQQLHNLNPMYRYSLESFANVILPQDLFPLEGSHFEQSQ